ncbi:hypothetical protein CFBP1573P_05748 [Pseudomonas syringae pv. persicae]|uniref:Uncharacterized protein n=1 Tax=Pseudomonas syringae pv. persicae TaxID=237306 RepID=A0AB38EM44_9PSED|nr:hypothetical protein NCPPB2254_05621 [Pseudomonas syringae pv. persicae]SOQ15841.1 hypothetical protein CFBP1573P_05748 [Pseudomonas syringae pv. persicae]
MAAAAQHWLVLMGLNEVRTHDQQANLLAYRGSASAETTEYHRRKADT